MSSVLLYVPFYYHWIFSETVHPRYRRFAVVGPLHGAPCVLRQIISCFPLVLPVWFCLVGCLISGSLRCTLSMFTTLPKCSAPYLTFLFTHFICSSFHDISFSLDPLVAFLSSVQPVLSRQTSPIRALG